MRVHIPNIVSLLRVVIAPVFFCLLLSGGKAEIIAAMILYCIGAMTDFFDGFLARRMKVVSSLGTFLDPLADKVLTSFAFIAFVAMGLANVWLVVIIIARDIFTTYMRIVADKLRKPLVTSWTAKVKTFLQMIYIFGVLALILIDALTDNSMQLVQTASDYAIIDVILLLLTGLTVYSTVEYIRGNRNIFCRK